MTKIRINYYNNVFLLDKWDRAWYNNDRSIPRMLKGPWVFIMQFVLASHMDNRFMRMKLSSLRVDAL